MYAHRKEGQRRLGTGTRQRHSRGFIAGGARPWHELLQSLVFRHTELSLGNAAQLAIRLSFESFLLFEL